MELLADPPRPKLEALLRNLDRDPVRSKRVIRQFVEDDRAGFLKAAIPILKTQADSRGAQYLLGVVVANGLLMPVLCDAAISKEVALSFAQAASGMDPTADMKLARTLADDAETDDGARVEQHGRLMEILETISDGARLFPSLVRLLRHPNPHIRSKAVLMIGRGNRSPKWIRQRLADTDPRIRANATEALWGVKTDEAREMLQSLVRDSNNRVAGNAILGLYRLGDCSMIPELVGMARHESALFRATAAWAMGETGDPRFTPVLAGLLREPNAVVRKRAFSALGNIRISVAQAHQGGPWRLSARMLEPDGAKPGRRLLLGLVGESGGGAPALLPTQILLAEEGQSILNYRVAERPLPETMCVVFLLPPRGGKAVLDCLPWKRPSDLWASVYYTREPSESYDAQIALRFQSAAEAITANLARPAPPEESGDLWHTIVQIVNLENGGVGGKRQLMIINEPGDKAWAGSELIAAVRTAQAYVQVISTGPDPAVEDFCRRVNGAFRIAEHDTVVQAYLNLFTNYEVSYQTAKPDARTLKIRLHAPGICAEIQLALGSAPAAAPEADPPRKGGPMQ